MTTNDYLEELVTKVNKAVKEDRLDFASLIPYATPYPSETLKYIGGMVKAKDRLPDQIKREVVLAGSGIYIKLARAYALRNSKEDMKKAEEYIAKAERDSNNYNVGWSTEVSTIKAILSNGKK
ncbi:hypothetical protein J4414_03905 [Candidatus Woesearchaeota archaeon]|nr:hypothetical protein [Candidatus Woesearchaeota archaeon]